MTRPGFTARNPELTGRSVLVIGAGKSGRAAAALAADRGARVMVADSRPEARLSTTGLEAVSRLQKGGVLFQFDGHPASLLETTGAELVVVSPGVPQTVPVIAVARERNVPVWGEIELAARFIRGKVIGITGSNGKSTVTTMTGTILRGGSIPGGTGGNLDTPLAELLHKDGPDAIHAVELSSFQLEAIETFDPAVAVILNLTPDHLDRYTSFEAYGQAKARLLEVQSDRHSVVLNADDPESRQFLAAVRGVAHFFSLRAEQKLGAFVRDGDMILRTSHGEERVMAASDLPVPGDHNLANALAAALACRLAGCPVETIAAGLKSYTPLSHRLQKVRTVHGVTFYNDSKATNLDAAVQAIRSFPGERIHLILGGKDKGGDWAALVPLLSEKVTSVLLVGAACGVIADALADRVPWIDCGTVSQAVCKAWSNAEKGDIVLLSPGCASFDQYAGFEDRGDDFIRAVEEIDHA